MTLLVLTLSVIALPLPKMFAWVTEPCTISLSDAREADAEQQRPGRLLLHLERDVDLVGRAGDRLGLDLDLVEVAEPVDALARELDLLGVVERALELAHLAPDHLVARLGVADDVDAPHVHAPPGVDHDGEGDRALLLVDVGIAFALANA